MKSENYEDAMQLFERARTQMRRHESRQLLVISLVSFVPTIVQCIEIDLHLSQISGWKFNDLGITIRRCLCEALYASGRAREGGESLLNMINTFDDVMYMSEPITKWVSGKFMLCQFGCRAFDNSPQISPADVSPLPKATVTQLRWQAHTVKRRCFVQTSIRQSSQHS